MVLKQASRPTCIAGANNHGTETTVYLLVRVGTAGSALGWVGHR